jgi:hypothetical protein
MNKLTIITAALAAALILSASGCAPMNAEQRDYRYY